MSDKKKSVVDRLWDRSVPWYYNFRVAPVTINGYVFLVLVLFSVWAYQHDVNEYKEVFENPCEYCNACSSGSVPVWSGGESVDWKMSVPVPVVEGGGG